MRALEGSCIRMSDHVSLQVPGSLSSILAATALERLLHVDFVVPVQLLLRVRRIFAVAKRTAEDRRDIKRRSSGATEEGMKGTDEFINLII